ncbi:MAG: hypothetical protein E7605_03560 [Ruminococcaceae bacterium]|nr:hypothetical protein [Oscillospiraceae bacterium]
MKKFLVILMVLALCVLTFVACEPQQPVDPQPEVTYDANAAVTYVFNLYKDSTTKQEDFEVTATVQVGGIAYDIEWTASEGATVTKKDDKTYTVDIDEKSATGYEFTLTATAKAADGTTAQKAIKFNVPKYEVLSFEQYMAAKEDDTVLIEGIVVAINSKAAGNTRNHLFLADANVVGGYYSYQMDADPVADLGIEVGMTVSVSGPIAPYHGMQEIKGGTAKIVDATKKEYAPVDITDKFAAGESLKNYVGLPVTIKGVEIAGQELGGTSDYLKFKLNEEISYIRTYVTDFPTTLKIVVGEDGTTSSPDKTTIDEAHAEKFGWKANVTGILVLYNSAPYLIPMDTGCFEYLEKVEKTPEQKIADTLEGLKLDASFTSDAVVELLAAGAAYPEVTLTWTSNSEHAVIADGKLTITVPDAATEAIVTVTATCDGKTATKEFKIKLSKSVTPVADIIALGASKEHNTYTEEKYLVAGIITEVYNTQYGNMKITDDQGNVLTIYGTYSADGADRYDAMANKPVAGDYVVIFGIVGQYNGTPQVKNGWIMSFTTPTSVKDTIDLGASKEHNTYTEEKHLVTGVITEVYNTQYGNMKITDAEGNILTIYGTYSATGALRYDAMEKKPVAGDTVTIYGIVGQYNGTPQIKNGWIVANVAGAGETPDPDPEPSDDPAPDSTLTVEQVIALGASKEHNTYTEGKYYVTGVITEIYNTQYGNMKITDDKGNILTIYGTFDATGANRFDAMANQPAVGDTVTIYGIVGQYNNTPQIKNGWITEQKPAAPEAPSFIEVPIDSDKWDQCKLKLDFQGMPMSQHRNWAAGSSLHVGAFMYRYGEITAVGEAPVIDISGMKYIEFDVYVSHIDVIAEALFSFELTSSGASDKEENCKKFYGKDTGWVVGWNHVKWNLSDFTEHGPDGKPMDATKWNFIRWYSDSTITVGEEKLKVAIANIKFTNDDYVEEEKPEEPETPETPETPATGNKADFNTFYDGAAKTQYATHTTAGGWTVNNAQVIIGTNDADVANTQTGVFSFIGGAGTSAAVINGKTSAVGSIVSPTLANGIASLSFQYGHPYSEANGVNITITIKKGGEVVATKDLVIAAAEVAQNTAYSYTWTLDTAVDGEFTIEIVNNCPTASSKNKDRLAIWDITWSK